MTINQKSFKHSVKKTDLWLPLWVGPYLADTQHLTRDEHGGYFLLLLAYWRNGGPLLDDDKRLASITKSTAKEWKKLKPILSEFFTVADGRWTQKRMEKEIKGKRVVVKIVLKLLNILYLLEIHKRSVNIFKYVK